VVFVAWRGLRPDSIAITAGGRAGRFAAHAGLDASLGESPRVKRGAHGLSSDRAITLAGTNSFFVGIARRVSLTVPATPLMASFQGQPKKKNRKQVMTCEDYNIWDCSLSAWAPGRTDVFIQFFPEPR
jgi:hypothetical protein